MILVHLQQWCCKENKMTGWVHKLSPEEREQLLAWAAEGIGYTEISRRLDNKVSKQRVQQLCRRANIDVMEKKKREQLQEEEKKRKLKLGSFYQEDKELVDMELRNRAFKKFQQKRRCGHWNMDITFGDIDWPSVCPILGIELDYYDPRKENSAEFDRIDSTKGYIKGNVWVISRRANRVKNDGTAEEHRLVSNAMFKQGVK